MKIGILEPGYVPDTLQQQFPSYPEMCIALLRSLDPKLTFQIWCVLEDDFPQDVTEADAWIVTGSKHGVYENTPWMTKLQEFLRKIVDQEIPVFGICFGHQILATALGGEVIKSDKGWGVGVQTYAVSNDVPTWLENSPETLKINAFHQDQVIKAPDNAKVWASSEFCPLAGLQYGPYAASFQPHPEFSQVYEEALLKSRLDILPDDVYDQALSSLKSDINSQTFAKSLLNFLTQKQPAEA